MEKLIRKTHIIVEIRETIYIFKIIHKITCNRYFFLSILAHAL